MAGTIISRTMTSGGNRQKWTLSMWVKQTNQKGQGGSSYQRMYDAGGDTDWIRFNETDCVLDASFASGGADFKTNRQFRDCSGWYHLVIRCDTTTASNLDATDRYRLYVNGIEETSFSTDDTASLGFEGATNQSGQDVVLGGASTTDQNFNGIMSHVHMCDGYSYAPTEFGATDATSGEWKIITSPSVSHGSQGFWLKMEDSSNLDLDSSSNAHTFTTSGNLTPTEDNPSNVFATMNSVATTNAIGNTITFSNGNTTGTNSGGGGWQPIMSTLAASKGKYYAEFKVGAIGGASKYGIIDVSQYNGQVNWVSATRGYGYEYNEGAFTAGASLWDNSWSGITNFTTNDIISVAMDLDNMKLYFGKNGTWLQSADPTSGATGTGTQTYFGGSGNTANATGVDTYAFAMNIHNSSVTYANFGNGYFGTTAVDSAGTNASNIGIFEYDVPAGYTALSTKGLNS